MAPTKVIERTEPVVAPRVHTVNVRSRLPAILQVPVLVGLNLGIRAILWSVAENFLVPELGVVSKVPTEDDLWSLYSPLARMIMNILTITSTWYLGYDYYDVGALTVLTNAPYAYLLATYYGISTLTVATHVNIEVFAIGIPVWLLRSLSVAHNSNAPLRNRFLLKSMQVQLSNALLAICVYIVTIWGALKLNFLNIFLVTYFNIPTLEAAYAETPLSIAIKVAIAGVAAKEFLLNPSIAAQPLSGTVTPEERFNPATATLDQTIKANVLPADKRKKTLFQQTVILNTFLFVSTVQRCMTLDGSEAYGAAGYSALWVAANTVLSLWFSWVGDTSSDYEPL